jgi:hypothetical protein
VRERIAPVVEATSGALAFRLDVGLPDHIDPLWERDLDNYLFPIARELPRRRRLGVGNQGTRGELVRADRAGHAGKARPDWHGSVISRSPGTEGVSKSAVRKAAEATPELPEGPVGLQLGFTIGPGRRWPSIWKSSIDALDPLLGRTYPDRGVEPAGRRIVRLGLHQVVDAGLASDIAMVVHARAADKSWPELAWLP